MANLELDPGNGVENLPLANEYKYETISTLYKKFSEIVNSGDFKEKQRELEKRKMSSPLKG